MIGIDAVTFERLAWWPLLLAVPLLGLLVAGAADAVAASNDSLAASSPISRIRSSFL